jgi:hypothetical protein
MFGSINADNEGEGEATELPIFEHIITNNK